MNAPFRNVGIVFFVTIVHVIVIAVYSSRALSESTIQRSIVTPGLETLEVMPEQLIKPERSREVAKAADFPLETADSVESDTVAPVSLDEKPEALKEESPSTFSEVAEKAGEPEAPTEKQAERWEESDFAKRVSFPSLDGIIGKQSKSLVENKPIEPVSKLERKDSTGEPAPRVRSFSPIPKS